MTAMTEEEYEDRQRRLEADAKVAKVALQNAQARYDKLCWELMNLRIECLEQQR